MNYYLLSCDDDDAPSEPLLAETVEQAADLYVQAVIDGRAGITPDALGRSACVYIDQFVTPEVGVGLMKDALSTSIPMKAIPSWKAHLDSKAPMPIDGDF